MANNSSYRSAAGGVRILLRLEGLMLLAVALFLYSRTGASWGRFAALLLLPDLAFLAYLWGARAGALAYNATHSTLGPLVLGAAALTGLLPPSLLPLALIWAAHVGMDRALGYGLKYASAFGDTHLGRIGRATEASSAHVRAV